VIEKIQTHRLPFLLKLAVGIIIGFIMLALVSTPAFAAEPPESSSDLDEYNLTFSGNHVYYAAFDILDMVNEERQKAGAPPVVMTKQLFDGANQRGAEAYLSFSHTRTDGTLCFTVSPLAYGENIASIIAWGTPAKNMMTMWMNSPGHRDNILNPNWTEIGVGMYSNSGAALGVQLFGNRTVIPTDDLLARSDYPEYESKTSTIYCKSAFITRNGIIDTTTGDKYITEAGKLAYKRWVIEEPKTYYVGGADGLTLVSGRVKIGADTYFFANNLVFEDGSSGMIKDWLIDDVTGNVYYYGKDGKEAQNKIVTFTEPTSASWNNVINFAAGKYYFGSNGKMVKSKMVKVGSNKYYFDASGKMVQSKIVKVGSSKYYLSSNGKMVKSKTVKIQGAKYHFAANGKMVKSKIVKVGNAKYYFGSNGKMVKSKIVKVKGSKYYFAANGKMVKNKTVKVNGHKYYFGSNGKLVKTK
jgi:glucan-binding YG repeat protein